jgi:hypothetical protein
MLINVICGIEDNSFNKKRFKELVELKTKVSTKKIQKT